MSDFKLVSACLEQQPGASQELLRRFGAKLGATTDQLLFFPEAERTQLIVSCIKTFGPESRDLLESGKRLHLSAASLLSALLLDFWPTYAAANGLFLQTIHSSSKKRQPDFLVSGLNLLARNLREINSYPEETGVALHLLYATVAALRPRDLIALSGKDKTPANLFTQLDFLYSENQTGLQPLLGGLVSEIRLEHLKRLVAAEDREQTLDFSLLERFADCEQVRKSFFLAPAPARVPPLPEHLVDSLRLRKKTLPPDPGANSTDAEEAYFGRLDVLLGSERLFLLAQAPKKDCFTHLEGLLTRHGWGEAESLVSHALACERCATVLAVLPLHEAKGDKRLPLSVQRRMQAQLQQYQSEGSVY